MSPYMYGLIIGLFVGGSVGFVIALMIVAAARDKR